MQVGDYKLDEKQEEIIKSENDYILVTAGAGSGKTLTILGKIKYLIEEKNIAPEEILCISFTNAATKSLAEKIKKDIGKEIKTYTFHKLSLEIIKSKRKNFSICDDSLLEMVTTEFFTQDVWKNTLIKQKLENFFHETCDKITKEELKQLEKLCITFIKLMKSNNYALEDFINFHKEIRKIKNIKHYNKEKFILILILNIYRKYEQYLLENNELDFDDLITYATKIIKNKKRVKKIKHIIIDEYQDTSFIRFALIRELINKTKAKLFVVGDDFQSIYKFSGCDISLFLNFKDFFPNAKIMKLCRTYRNSEELIKIAGKFVMKNKKQIKKNLTSEKHLKYPIKIITYYNLKETFLNLIATLPNSYKILVLGRNNKDINLILSDKVKEKENKIVIENDNREIDYMTIHKSKGLESDIVIIINLENSITSLPSQIKEERLTRLVMKNKEKYPFAEERRLFYVALTRTKNKVFLLVPQKSPSIFIEELEYIINHLEKETKFFKSPGSLNKKS